MNGIKIGRGVGPRYCPVQDISLGSCSGPMNKYNIIILDNYSAKKKTKTRMQLKNELAIKYLLVSILEYHREAPNFKGDALPPSEVFFCTQTVNCFTPTLQTY